MIRLRLLVVISILCSLCVWLETDEVKLLRDGYSICLIIEDNTPAYEDYHNPEKIIGHLKFSDFFIVLNSIDTNNQKYSEILLPSYKTAWISRDNCYEIDLDLLGGTGKKDSYPVYTSPTDKKIITGKGKSIPFHVKRIALIQSDGALNVMFKVRYRTYNIKEHYWDYQEDGWVKAEDIELFPAPLYIQYVHSLINRLGSPDAPSRLLPGAIALMKNLLIHYPDTYYYGGSIRQVLHSGVEALKEMAKGYVELKQYELGIKTLQQVAKEYPAVFSDGRRGEYAASMEIAQIYWHHMNQPDKALNIMHDVIKRFSSQPVWAFEYASTCGMEAFYEIIKISDQYQLSSSIRMKHYRKVIKESDSPAVKVTASRCIADELIKKKQYKDAIRVLYKIIKKYPCGFYEGWMFMQNESIIALEKLIEILIKDIDNPQKAIQICLEISQQPGAMKCGDLEALDQYLGLKSAALSITYFIQDYTTGERELVLDNYRKLLNSSPESSSLFENFKLINLQGLIMSASKQSALFWSRDNCEFSDWPYYIAWIRLKEIEAYEPGKRSIIHLASMKKYPDIESPEIITLFPATEVNALYKIRLSISWIKVKLNDGTIGWVQETCLSR